MMNKIDCNECRGWLHAYLDNELDTELSLHIAGHLVHCAACTQCYDEITILAASVKKSIPYYDAPAALTKNIMSNIHLQITPATSIWQTLNNVARNWLVPSFSVAVLTVALLLYVAAPSHEDSFVDEAVSDHIRSLMGEHLNDVISSDKHTVKPWFAGKLDFAPPVYDFSTKGYALLGGRLEYLQHQTAAALSYKHNKHIINAFILPTTDADTASHSLSKRGYNIVFWRQNHMQFIVVSDLNKVELEDLVRDIQNSK